jgi:hypothetical protein
LQKNTGNSRKGQKEYPTLQNQPSNSIDILLLVEIYPHFQQVTPLLLLLEKKVKTANLNSLSQVDVEADDEDEVEATKNTSTLLRISIKLISLASESSLKCCNILTV